MLRVLCAAALLASASLPAAARTKVPPKPKPLPPVHYVCEDGTRLAIAYSAPGTTPSTATVRILGTDKELALTQAPSADHGHYAGGTAGFNDEGATGTFTQDGKTLPCRAKR